MYDVLIVGGGPAGLSAALALGRARKRVLLCDSGPRRNAKAKHIQNFVTRDGTPPDEFRRIARQQLEAYSNVHVRDERVGSIEGAKNAFRAQLESESIETRRVLLCTGMLDQMMSIEGFAELWGQSIFQCPYCHGWEIQDRAWGVLARPEDGAHVALFALQLRGWSRNVTVFTNGGFELPDDAREQLRVAKVKIESAPIVRLNSRDGHLESLALTTGDVQCEVLFAHPPQKHVPLIDRLGVRLGEDGFVQVDPMKCETSVPGIYAAGDLTTRMQAAVLGAAHGMRAAAMMNLDLTMELTASGEL